MFTTAGALIFAMFRNVVASIGPDSGALFIAGTAMPCAEDAGQVETRGDHHADRHPRDGDQDGVKQ